MHLFSNGDFEEYSRRTRHNFLTASRSDLTHLLEEREVHIGRSRDGESSDFLHTSGRWALCLERVQRPISSIARRGDSERCIKYAAAASTLGDLQSCPRPRYSCAQCPPRTTYHLRGRLSYSSPKFKQNWNVLVKMPEFTSPFSQNMRCSKGREASS